MPTSDLPLRFQEKITVSDDGHWLWRTQSVYGYAGVKIGGRMYLAHRAVYELLVGPIPEGFHVDHVCRVRNCVNPDHLEAVTPQVNTLRSPTAPAAINARKTECIRGHPFDGPNTYTTPDGRRQCRVCLRASNARALAKRRA